MENRFFPAAVIPTLMAFERWKLVSSAFPIPLKAVRNDAHRRWAAAHPHLHPTREILLILEGDGVQSFAGRVYPARGGTAFLFDSMEAHDLGYPREHPPALHLWLAFVQDRCVATAYRFAGGRRRPTEQWRRLFSLQELGLASIDPLFPSAQTAPAMPPALRRRHVASAMALLVARLLALSCAPPAPERSHDFHGDVIATIQRHIREAGGRDCRIGTLARVAGYSPYHFHRLFRAHAGLTLGRYVDRCRREAFARLAASGMRQKAIAEALGFSHASALSRWRKREAG